MMPRTVRRLFDHASIGPIAVRPQSNALMRRLISVSLAINLWTATGRGIEDIISIAKIHLDALLSRVLSVAVIGRPCDVVAPAEPLLFGGRRGGRRHAQPIRVSRHLSLISAQR
jgi:hypothetical protein